MSRIFYKKTENIEFVEYPYRMWYYAIIFDNGKITLKPIIPNKEEDFCNMEYTGGSFEYLNNAYLTTKYLNLFDIPNWFRNWSKKNISEDNFDISYSEKEREIMNFLNFKREQKLQQIGII